MNAVELGPKILSKLREHGLKGTVVPSAVIRSIGNEIGERYRNGEFDEKFYQVELAPFSFDAPEALPDPKSLIIIVSPQPQVRVLFSAQGKAVPVIVPPSYSYATDELGKGVLESLLVPEGYHVVRAKLLLKLLAVRSGLAQYGKNNITYVPGMGSFYRLTAFYTDLPSPERDFGEPRVMKLCRTCTACMEACPTDAIAADRFLLHAERCITFLNEFPGEFPSWVDPAWHNCLVGCLYCQKCCPANKRVADWVTDREAFSDEETQLLLRGASIEEFPEEMTRKLDRLSITEYAGHLGRNLSVLLRHRYKRAGS